MGESGAGSAPRRDSGRAGSGGREGRWHRGDWPCGGAAPAASPAPWAPPMLPPLRSHSATASPRSSHRRAPTCAVLPTWVAAGAGGGDSRAALSDRSGAPAGGAEGTGSPAPPQLPARTAGGAGPAAGQWGARTGEAGLSGAERCLLAALRPALWPRARGGGAPGARGRQVGSGRRGSLLSLLVCLFACLF